MFKNTQPIEEHAPRSLLPPQAAGTGGNKGMPWATVV
jgi:hypothetical protein